MQYAEQQAFLERSRMFNAALVLVLGAAAAFAFMLVPGATAYTAFVYSLVLAGVAASLAYTPDYLHLTVYPNKPARWQTRMRWPVIAAVFVLGLADCSSIRDLEFLLASIAWLSACNLLARNVRSRLLPWFFFATDLALICALVMAVHLGPLLSAALLAAAAHVFVVACEERPFLPAVIAAIMGIVLLEIAGQRHIVSLAVPAAAAPLVLSAFATAAMVARADERNRLNLGTVMRGLIEFTGYSTEKIEHLMAVSDRELASKWQQAEIAQDDAEQMAEWYWQNSELYLFALVSFNLDYKRIRYYVRILRIARGSCLDYGAGNGELLIELARRGHPVVYYDVDGLTMKYARHRAATENLSIQFVAAKPDLAHAAQVHGFDTIFSLDVLEHLPDLPGELAFLSSLLNNAGSLIFNLPAGSTKSHPMHLAHDLNVRAFLAQKGLRERKASRLAAIGKDEMYIFERA